MKPLVRLEVKGLDTLQGRLADLEDKLRRRVIRSALRPAMRVYRRKIQANIMQLDLSPSGKEQLRRNLTVRVEKARRGNILFGRVRMRHPGKPIWLWIEKGTQDRYRVVKREFDFITVHRGSFLDPRSKTGKYRRATTYRMMVLRPTWKAYTGRMKEQPFVRPAIEAGTDEAIAAFRKALRIQIDKAWRASK